MNENNEIKPKEPRSFVAMYTLIFSGAAIVALAAIAIIKGKPEDTMTIFNICLPVFASWVGTILAFYFGKANFESANAQVNKLISQRFSQEDLNKTPLKIIMRPFSDMTCFKIPAGKGEKDFQLKELNDLMNADKNRLPVITSDNRPLYMIHLSTIDAYTSAGGQLTDTLQQFLDAKRGTESGFGMNEGFIVLAEITTIAEAKEQLDKIKICQDIFVTKNGTPNEELSGWLSNTRLARLLQI
jgi:hypothetical protein